MESFCICTWNVVHRVYAERNVESCPILLERYPREANRISDISAFVEDQFVQGSRVVCLQEVSGDQLVVLRERLGGRVSIFEQQQGKIPEPPADTPPKARLFDNSEYLVVLTDFPAAKIIAGVCFNQAQSKGVLAVQIQNNVVVFNCHVSQGKAGERQIREETMQQLVLPWMRRNRQNQAILAGDFGRELDKLYSAIGELAFCSGEDLSEFSKQGKHTFGDKDHDHIVGLGGTEAADAMLFPNANLSTHQPLRVLVRSRINSPALRAAGTRSGFRDYSADTLNP